eukprot:2169693-Rhodomonas_salina.1
MQSLCSSKQGLGLWSPSDCSVIQIAELRDLQLCSVISFRIFGLTESTLLNGRVITHLGWRD